MSDDSDLMSLLLANAGGLSKSDLMSLLLANAGDTGKLVPFDTDAFLAEERRTEVTDALEANEALLADGFEDAFIGYIERFSSGPIALYDRGKCIKILMERDGMTWEGADEFFGFNVLGAWAGDGTPAFATLLTEVP